jgi:hypothetical protein
MLTSSISFMLLLFVPGIGVFAGVDLDGVCLHVAGRFDLLTDGIDEKAHPDLVPVQLFDDILDPVPVPPNIQPSFCCKFLPTFRDKCGKFGKRIDRDLDDFLGGRHLQVQLCLDSLSKDAKIPVIDMPAVFAKMADDPMRPCKLADVRCSHRIRLDAAARFPQGGNVVYVDGELHGG